MFVVLCVVVAVWVVLAMIGGGGSSMRTKKLQEAPRHNASHLRIDPFMRQGHRQIR